MISAFYHPGFAAPIGQHIMPMSKFEKVDIQLRSESGIQILAPPPISRDDLERVHTTDYIAAIETGEPKALAESQKFPWSPELYPSVRLTNGGVLAAAEWALDHGVSAAIASGFHHAHADHGEGFCTFNGLIIAADTLRERRKLHRVAILDLDLHYGNGTAALAASRPWVRALSIYGNDYHANQAYRDVEPLRHQDGENHRSAALRAGSGKDHLIEVIESQLPWLLEVGRPDLLLFQAGADPFREDPYSPLNLGFEDLLERDRLVFRWAKQHGIPIAWTLAGGYTRDITKVVEVHLNTFRAARETYGK